MGEKGEGSHSKKENQNSNDNDRSLFHKYHCFSKAMASEQSKGTCAYQLWLSLLDHRPNVALAQVLISEIFFSH